MNFLSIFVLIPLLMLAGLWAARGIKAIRGVMVTGASALLIASVVLTFMYLGERSAGNTAEMLFRADTVWSVSYTHLDVYKRQILLVVYKLTFILISSNE